MDGLSKGMKIYETSDGFFGLVIRTLTIVKKNKMSYSVIDKTGSKSIVKYTNMSFNAKFDMGYTYSPVCKMTTLQIREYKNDISIKKVISLMETITSDEVKAVDILNSAIKRIEGRE